MVGREEIAQFAREAGFTDIADELAALARPALRLEYTDGEPSVGASKLGGLADLPPDVEWPDASTFFGQVDLAALDPSIWPGPHSGLLSFFCKQAPDYHAVDDGGAATVIYTAPNTVLERCAAPASLDEEFHLGQAAVVPRPEMTLPTIAVYPADVLVPFGFDWEGPRAEQEEAYNQFADQVAAAQGFQTVWSDEYGWLPKHRLLGWPEHVQGDVLPEIVLMHFDDHNVKYENGDLEKHAPDWRLLLQVEADRRLEASFGDGGTIFFGLPAEDLAAGRFDRVQAISQSS